MQKGLAVRCPSYRVHDARPIDPPVHHAMHSHRRERCRLVILFRHHNNSGVVARCKRLDFTGDVTFQLPVPELLLKLHSYTTLVPVVRAYWTIDLL